ncbi:MAG: XdhC family protein [Rhizobiaceae bacterium]|nr:XdhC family protein [Hyphomicrobiales bacterium]NRB31644.1 XdhC family protein [Rhizobiaceae bacterium]
MNAPADIHQLVSNLKQDGEPFAIATVIRTISVTSAKAGAKAVIQADGTVAEGWIGGGCARAAVLKAARDSIADGEPRLVSIQPEDLLSDSGVAAGDERDGVRFARNMCPSQGTMDVFVEPVIPRPELVILGASPVAVALAQLAKALGFSRTVCAPETDQQLFEDADRRISGFDLQQEKPGWRFVVVATQGKGDQAGLQAALTVEADYVAFVGSFKKAASLKEKLRQDGVSEDRLDTLKAPAGLDLKAITPEEIALSILSEIVLRHRSGQQKQLQIQI